MALGHGDGGEVEREMQVDTKYDVLKEQRIRLHVHFLGTGAGRGYAYGEAWGAFTQLTGGLRMIARFGGPHAKLCAEFFVDAWNKELFDGPIREHVHQGCGSFPGADSHSAPDYHPGPFSKEEILRQANPEAGHGRDGDW